MSNTIRISPAFQSLQQTRSLCYSCYLLRFSQYLSNSSFRTTSLSTNHSAYSRKVDVIRGPIKALSSHSEGGPVQGLDSSPVSVELEPISSESQFDRVIAEAQQLEESVDGKLVQEMYIFETKVGKTGSRSLSKDRFYCVDVNNVPHKLVVCAGVTKMPTIQLWKDGEKQAEVIGGHKAYLVVNEVREMIENEFTM